MVALLISGRFSGEPFGSRQILPLLASILNSGILSDGINFHVPATDGKQWRCRETEKMR
jgi:hypothetical protein